MKFQVRTKNRELYDKFSLFNFSDKVVLENVNSFDVNRVVNSINRKDNNVSIERIGNFVVLKKNKPIKFDVFWR